MFVKSRANIHCSLTRKGKSFSTWWLCAKPGVTLYVRTVFPTHLCDELVSEHMYTRYSTTGLGQNGRYFADDIFKVILLNANCGIIFFHPVLNIIIVQFVWMHQNYIIFHEIHITDIAPMACNEIHHSSPHSLPEVRRWSFGKRTHVECVICYISCIEGYGKICMYRIFVYLMWTTQTHIFIQSQGDNYCWYNDWYVWLLYNEIYCWLNDLKLRWLDFCY